MYQTADDLRLLQERIQDASQFSRRVHQEVARAIIGQQVMIDRLLVGLLSSGHVLLEGVPGLAKTRAIKSLAQTIKASFSRIQFTPDLLPADVIGTMIYNQPRNEFLVRKGPLFAHFILADEINRAPAKVQSALLEAMQERQVTIGETTFPLEEPFLVLATQNPIEQEGTYALPEAQVDRFMLKVEIGYPTREEEQLILRQQAGNAPDIPLQPVASVTEVMQARQLVRQIFMDEKIEQYIVDLVYATRFPERYQLQKLKPFLSFGGSPRATINLALAARANAFLQNRAFVVPEDIQTMAADVLRHRIGLTYEAEAENIKTIDLIQEIIRTIQVP